MKIKHINFKGAMIPLFMSMVFLASCVKQDGNAIDGVGTSYLRLDAPSGLTNVIGFQVAVTAMDASPHTQTTWVIHRDAVSNADLNKTVTCDFALDPTYLTTYNAAAQYVYDTLRSGDSVRVYNQDYATYTHFINKDGVLTPLDSATYDSLAAADPDNWDNSVHLSGWIAEVVAYAKDDASSQAADFAASNAPIQYVTLPPNTYSFTGTGVSGSTLTFAPGQTTLELQINIDPSTLSFTTNYAIPLALSNPSAGYKISEDNAAGGVGYAAKELVNQIIVKNQWDGIYSYTGFIGRWDGAGNNDASLGGPIASGVTVPIITAGPTTDNTQLLWATGGSGIGGIGSAQQITVNGDNSITLTPIGASPANWGPIAGKANKYDPATQTFTINYRWGGSDPGSSSGYTREVMLTLKYKGPR